MGNIDTLVSWVQSVVGDGVKVIIARTNAHPPRGPYLSIREMTSRSPEYPAIVKYDAVGGEFSEDAMSEEVLAFQFDVFAEGGGSLIRKIIAEAFGTTCPADITLREWGDIRNLDFLESSGFSPRYSCDLEFAFSYTHVIEDVEAQTIQMTGDFAGMNSTAAVALTPPAGGA